MHTHMNRPNRSLDWVLCHWAHFTVLRFIFVYVCKCNLCIFCMTVYCMCSYCNMLRRTWWDWGLSLGPLLPSVLWHCWLGQLTRKTRPRYDLWCVSWDVKPYSINQSINQREGRSFWGKISGGRGRPAGEYFLVPTKLDTFCYPTVQTAPCYVPSFWHNTGVWQTDGRTDGIAVANTALAMEHCTRCKNGVIWQNSVWLCVQDHDAALCACAKSCQPLTLP